MKERNIKSVDIDECLSSVVEEKARSLGISWGSMLKWLLYQVLQNELAQRGCNLIPKLIKKDWSKTGGENDND